MITSETGTVETVIVEKALKQDTGGSSLSMDSGLADFPHCRFQTWG